MHVFFKSHGDIMKLDLESISRNVASHFYSVPSSSELYRAYFGAFASTITGKDCQTIQEQILSIHGKKVGYSDF